VLTLFPKTPKNYKGREVRCHNKRCAKLYREREGLPLFCSLQCEADHGDNVVESKGLRDAIAEVNARNNPGSN
jgi:hypothetical protein